MKRGLRMSFKPIDWDSVLEEWNEAYHEIMGT